MSEIETLVLNQLQAHSELIATNRGVIWHRGDDKTCLKFVPATNIGQRDLHSIAHVKTTFGKLGQSWSADAIAHLNKRSCFGYFSHEDGHLQLNASFSIFEHEPASTWIAGVLLRALGEQLALGFGIAQSFAHPELLPLNRANLEYPRDWKTPPLTAIFEATAASFCDRGLASTAGNGVLVAEVPMAKGPPSRLMDSKAETALLKVSTNVRHPLAGCGYAATVVLPYDPAPALLPAICDRLNKLEEGPEDFVPRFGAWGIRSIDTELVYSFFWPTDYADSTLLGTIMNWMVLRTVWLRENHWQPGVGISMEGLADD
jgi:hypothetical protein